MKSATQEIASLNWETDYERILYLLAGKVFSWDYQKSLEFALFRTFAVPSISSLLDKTKEFEKRTRKRYDDTELILAEILENGLDSPRAKMAFRRMNAMHNSFSISNDDFLYVSSTFIFTPIEWIDKFGWRKLTVNEKKALFKYNQEVAKRMNIKNLPDTYEAFYQFYKDYEKEHFKPNPSNVNVAQPTIKLLLGFYLPGKIAFTGEPVARCFMDDPLLEAMSMKKPNILLRKIVWLAMKTRAVALRILPKRKKPFLRTHLKRPTYPQGYEIGALGTFPKGKVKEF